MSQREVETDAIDETEKTVEIGKNDRTDKIDLIDDPDLPRSAPICARAHTDEAIERFNTRRGGSTELPRLFRSARSAILLPFYHRSTPFYRCSFSALMDR